MVTFASSNSDLRIYESKHKVANYEFAVKYYLDIDKNEKKQICDLAVNSFEGVLNYDVTPKDFEDTLFGTLAIILYFKGKIIGYCSICPYLDKDFTRINNQKYTTFGIHWLCVDKQFRGLKLGTELLAKAYNIVQTIASKKTNPVILFGEFTPHSHYLSQKLFQYDPNLILGYGVKTPTGQKLSLSYAKFWSEYVEEPCTSDNYGLLSNGRNIVAIQFN
jgi:GNAT superfamily N-acetyltransferase